MKINENDFLKEFKDFLSTETLHKPSHSLTNQVFKFIENDLRSLNQKVLLKLFIIYFTVGFLTLFICPQFGISPFGGNEGILKFIMPYGPVVCGAVCGLIFLGLSTVIAFFILKENEKYKLEKNILLFLTSFSLLSLIVFLIFNLMLSRDQVNALHNHQLLQNGFMFSSFSSKLIFLITWLFSSIFGSRFLYTLTKKIAVLKLNF
jgi:hypothetical protein